MTFTWERPSALTWIRFDDGVNHQFWIRLDRIAMISEVRPGITRLHLESLAGPSSHREIEVEAEISDVMRRIEEASL